ncbi:MAG: ATP-binding protein [bacterium]
MRAEEEQIKLEVQLQQAQKMESIGRLAGGVAHDFNNMLQVILGNAYLAMEDVPADSSIYESLSEIKESAERSADLTQKLLIFARKQVVIPKVIDLNDTVEKMVKMLGRLIGEDVDLTWLPGTDLWHVKIDSSQVDQILANLCVNARDAIVDIGKITIETENRTLDYDFCKGHVGCSPGEYVCVSVSDNGCGIDKENLKHIFEPFFTTKEIGKGTGLGLATVYGAVKQNNGFIYAYSEPAVGTTFKIYFPRYYDEEELAEKKIMEQPVPIGHETILLVEDELIISRLVQRMLSHLGYQVFAANTTKEAISLAEEHANGIDLLITDVIMPDMNGHDLAQYLLERYSKMKSLFMSGYTADVIARHGVLEEGIHFLQKPFSEKELAIKIREVLEEE